MSTSSVVVGQGAGVPVEFRVLQGLLALSDYTTAAAFATRGVLVKVLTSQARGIQVATTGDVHLEGVLNDVVFDPSTLPAGVGNNIFGAGLFDIRQVGETVSVWKIARLFVTAVSGSVAYGDYLKPTTSGQFISNGATNPLTNGSITCQVPNTVSGGPIEIFVNLA